MDIGVAYKLCHTKTNPAYYPDTQPPAHESDIRVLSYNIEEILKSVEQYVKDGKIGFFTEQNDTGETESTTIPVTKICLEYYIDETAEGIVYSPDEQELFYIDGETGALIRDAFGW